MLPSDEAFAASVSALDIQNKDAVIVYDGKGQFSAARVWWMFRVFGHNKVWVLDGGLPQWCKSGYEVESTLSQVAISRATSVGEAIKNIYRGQLVGPASFKTKFQPHLVWTLDQIKQNMSDQTHQHIDARSKSRFDGVAPEPREGIKSGHMHGSKCVPFTEVKKSLPNLLMRCLTCFNVPALKDLLFIRQNSVTVFLGGQDEFKCVDLPHISVFSQVTKCVMFLLKISACKKKVQKKLYF
ncbi:hypothetical protein B296_00029652 [Ensete ventricosum]|uniref:Rhodanese domain-containing protein n=1 Tax=Ensete ventricosum TaxID=4639 RepID=A0A427ABE3_ENSVE|nr:hypothetical protein B296_00029652 [Ensete ventricosum]